MSVTVRAGSPIRKLRVLWFVNVPLTAYARATADETVEVGGWLDSLQELICRRDDLELAVATATDGQPRVFTESRVRYYCLPTGLREPTGAFARVAMRWKHSPMPRDGVRDCIDVVRDFTPDLVHVHGTEGYYGLVQKSIPMPTVVSLQGFLVECSRAYFRDLPIRDCLRDATTMEFLKGRGLIHGYAGMRRGAQQEKRILRACRTVMGRTAWDATVACERAPHATYHKCGEVLREPFWRTAWRPAQSGDQPVLVMVTGGAPYKGLHCALEALRLLRRSEFPTIRLRVIGPFLGTALHGTAVRWLKRMGLESSVTFLGTIPAAEVAEELSGASIYVHPSWVDNSPNALGEAMLVGIPCVASRVGGIPSLVTDKESAVLFPPGDFRALAEAVHSVLLDRRYQLSLSAAGRLAACVTHDPKTVVEQLLKCYSSAVEGAWLPVE